MTDIYCGIDIISNKRMKKLLEKSPHILEDIFSEEEMKYCFSKKENYISFAARFAAKEAFLKAIDKGILNFDLNEIEIINQDSGKPFINIRSEKIRLSVEDILKKKDFKIALSISHETGYSVAQVIIY